MRTPWIVWDEFEVQLRTDLFPRKRGRPRPSYYVSVRKNGRACAGVTLRIRSRAKPREGLVFTSKTFNRGIDEILAHLRGML